MEISIWGGCRRFSGGALGGHRLDLGIWHLTYQGQLCPCWRGSGLPSLHASMGSAATCKCLQMLQKQSLYPPKWRNEIPARGVGGEGEAEPTASMPQGSQWKLEQPSRVEESWRLKNECGVCVLGLGRSCRGNIWLAKGQRWAELVQNDGLEMAFPKSETVKSELLIFTGCQMLTEVEKSSDAKRIWWGGRAFLLKNTVTAFQTIHAVFPTDLPLMLPLNAVTLQLGLL